MRKINCLVGGPTEDWPDNFSQVLIEEKNNWIGVDRGAWRLLEAGVTPLAAIGDFDSLKETEREKVFQQVPTILTAPAEKDETDTEMAVEYAFKTLKADQVTLYGATGGRLDHFLSNLFFGLAPRFEPFLEKIKLIDRQNTLTFFKAGKHHLLKEADKKYLAFIPLIKTTKFSILDAKYLLDKVDISYPVSYASNEFVADEVHFSFESGVVCVIQSKD